MLWHYSSGPVRRNIQALAHHEGNINAALQGSRVDKDIILAPRGKTYERWVYKPGIFNLKTK